MGNFETDEEMGRVQHIRYEVWEGKYLVLRVELIILVVTST